ncbi:MAG: MBL fold metallo-hydrolase [Antricoccus sp.]
MTHPLYETRRDVTPYASVVLANNPDHMTLDGTNTWLLRAPGRREAIVIDPGPEDVQHLDVVAAEAGTVVAILLTHGHWDHSESARRFHEMTGAPVRALDPAHRYGGEGLGDGDVIDAAGIRVDVIGTPGHTSDSLCFVIDDGQSRSVLTGDTILGRGTTVVAHPDGVLAEYLDSLERLKGYGDATVLPGHGPELPSAVDAATHYLAHRAQRLQQVREALESLGPKATPRQVVETVYADVDQAVWGAAELSVRAQIAYLRS